MRKEKKAISAIVATVLLILITVAAVGIIWGALVPWITNIMRQGQVNQECITATANLEIDTDAGLTYFINESATKNATRVTVKRGGEEFDAAGIKIVIFGDGTSKSFDIEAGKNSTKIRMYPDGLYNGNLSIPGVSEESTYVIDVTGMFTLPTEVSVAPIVKVDNINAPCPVSDTATLLKKFV